MDKHRMVHASNHRYGCIKTNQQTMLLSQRMMLQHCTTHTVPCRQRIMWQHRHEHPSTRDGSNDIDLIDNMCTSTETETGL